MKPDLFGKVKPFINAHTEEETSPETAEPGSAAGTNHIGGMAHQN